MGNSIQKIYLKKNSKKYLVIDQDNLKLRQNTLKPL